MQVAKHSPADYAAATAALLPPGAAWQWPVGGTGAALLQATGQELARVDSAVQGVLNRAVDVHRPAGGSWHISAYRAVAAAAVAGVIETMPRKTAVIGSRIGVRLWGHDAARHNFYLDLLHVDHLAQRSARIGSRIGDKLWSNRSRYFLRVQYYSSVVRPQPIWDALTDFKQAHVRLWFEDITGSGGVISHASDNGPGPRQ